jgi:hypothetical protein
MWPGSYRHNAMCLRSDLLAFLVFKFTILQYLNGFDHFDGNLIDRSDVNSSNLSDSKNSPEISTFGACPFSAIDPVLPTFPIAPTINE